MRAAHLTIAALLLVFVAGCDSAGESARAGCSDASAEAVYCNSFESAADIEGWPANGRLNLRDAAPAGGGERSVLVSGGCLYPHSAHTFSASESGTVALRAWGKNLEIGGGVALKNEATGERIHVQIKDETWQRVRSEEQLAVNAGDELQISMGAGGFVASAMLVTEVAVLRAD